MSRVQWTSDQFNAYEQKRAGMARHAIRHSEPYNHTDSSEKRSGGLPDSVSAHSGKDSLGVERQTEAERGALRAVYKVLGLFGIVHAEARYEGEVFRLPAGHVYTPDWVIYPVDGGSAETPRKRIVVEAKGDYRLPSQGRSSLAFSVASHDNPTDVFLWIKKAGRSLYKVEIMKAGNWVARKLEVYCD